MAKEGSYYHRKREERKEYQKLYYEVNKGRRKAGAVWHAQLAHSNPTDDPRRDADAEWALTDDCVALRDRLSEQLGEDGWVPEFIGTVQTWIDKYVREAHDLINGGVGAESLRLHRLRRLVAGLLQEQELAQQGGDARRAALEDLRLVLWGRRVNTRAFSDFYDW
ncbi:hypothetical protein FA95DRAFT_1608746 [Auriscalpium vulgare]|uniref:Uncharacterized protein n=1 Tax=Auriscalpium vulgare TaxID=40419 RepID=A0ACB8RK77_9AGAM|nr:hypothetical protein FA95DRAFT_1608746 [Auriscalpium vulgare]